MTEFPGLSSLEFSQLYDEAVQEGVSSGGEWTEMVGQAEEGEMLEDDSLAISPEVSKDPALSLADWEGPSEFQLRVPHSTKAREPQYSEELHKLFIKQNRVVALQVTHSLAGTSLDLEVGLVFSSPEHRDSPVSVCMLHSRETSGHPSSRLAAFPIRLTCPGRAVKYIELPSGAKIARLENLPAASLGSWGTTVNLKFTDLSSCPGGANRRETSLVLNLCQGSELVGRRVLPLRVCTCPRRDLAMELRARQSTTRQLKPREQSEEKEANREGTYRIVVHGADNYEALYRVARLLELNRPGGDVVAWEEEMKKLNQISIPLS